MSEAETTLPDGWAKVPLNVVASHHSGDSKIIKGKLPSEPTEGLFPAYSASGQDVWRPAFDHEGDAIIISAVGARCGKCFKASGKWSAIANTHVVWPNPDSVDRDFLWFKINNENFWVKGGSAQPFVKTRDSFKYELALPPLSEQRRIVEKIETLFARLDKGEEAVREVQKLLTRYRQSVLKSAVTGKLTADWRAERGGASEDGHDLLDRILETRRERWPGSGNYKKPVEPDTGELPEIPDGWVRASVDQILRQGLSNGRSVPDAEGEGFPVMRLTALKDGLINISERKEGRWSAEEAEPFLVEQGDILVSRGNGSKQLVGRGGLIAEPVDPVAYPDTMIRIPISLSYLSPEWFVQLWNSPFMRAQIEKAAKTTAGIYKINQGDIRSFVVPLPPFEEQERIAATVADEIAKTADLERWCETELKRSASLRQSILKDAFAGRLVPQDPSDEPASDLLARIAAEKTPTKKTRRKASA